jgi:histidinol-phosphatase
MEKQLMSGTPNLSDLLAVAIDAARLAGQSTLKYFHERIDVTIKADGTPVTKADVEAEAIIRREIARHFPHHTVLGEESGEITGSSANIRWIIDPLDGTKSFIRGVPMYGTLIGVEIDGKLSVGAAYLPATNEMLAAATGLGCTHNDKPAHVSKVNRIEDAALLTTSMVRCIARLETFSTLAAQASLMRGWGDAYGYAMVATGRVEIMIDPKISPWDIAALIPILREAGGELTGWNGQSAIRTGDAVATNGLLHPAMLAALRSANPLPPRKD